MRQFLTVTTMAIACGSGAVAEDSFGAVESSSSAPNGVQDLRINLVTGFRSSGGTDYFDTNLGVSSIFDVAPRLRLQGEIDFVRRSYDGTFGASDWNALGVRGALIYDIRPGLSFGGSVSAVKVEGADDAVFDYGVHALYAPADNTQLEVGAIKGEDDDGLFAYASVDYQLSAQTLLSAYAGHYFDGNDAFDADYTDYRLWAEHAIGNGIQVFGGLSGIANSVDTWTDVNAGLAYDVGRGAEVYVGAQYGIDSEETTYFLGGTLNVGGLGGGYASGIRIDPGLDFGDEDRYRIGASRSF